MPKILLVEDNEMNRDMLSRRLVRKGYDVVMAVDGGEGVAQAKSVVPDLILMDVSLPVMDGLEATRQIRAKEAAGSGSRVPILALTANARKEDIAECLAAGMDGHLSKPFDRQDLDEAIAKLMAAAPAA